MQAQKKAEISMEGTSSPLGESSPPARISSSGAPASPHGPAPGLANIAEKMPGLTLGSPLDHRGPRPQLTPGLAAVAEHEPGLTPGSPLDHPLPGPPRTAGLADIADHRPELTPGSTLAHPRPGPRPTPGLNDIAEHEPGLLEAVLARVSLKTSGFGHALVSRAWSAAAHRAQRVLVASRASPESDPRGMTEEEVRNLLAPFPDLRHIKLTLLQCPSEELLEHIANAAPNLKSLEIHASEPVSPAPLSWPRAQDILLRMPRLQRGTIFPWMGLTFHRPRHGSSNQSSVHGDGADQTSSSAAGESDASGTPDSESPDLAHIVNAVVSMDYAEDAAVIIRALDIGRSQLINLVALWSEP